MTKAQIDAIVAKAVAEALAAANKSEVKAKTYQAGVVKAGEALTVPKGHVAVIVPMSDKVAGDGRQYVASTKGVALHQKTGEGFSFACWLLPPKG